ncbi:hypothetical protein ZOSMA_74G00050 [Zostera marina]|uniref:Protein XRI1 n=1 Tax=Zostera marina TaxID=29655 RepID=A0A0K9NPH3_ZOSMR|nr:hypothetical protein ZOSMA_74G00050 [Zostera marina]
MYFEFLIFSEVWEMEWPSEDYQNGIFSDWWSDEVNSSDGRLMHSVDDESPVKDCIKFADGLLNIDENELDECLDDFPLLKRRRILECPKLNLGKQGAGELDGIRKKTVGEKFHGRISHSNPSSVVFPFAILKPSSVEGDITLHDINQRICLPSISSPEFMNDDHTVYIKPKSSSDDYCCHSLTSVFSGKPVVKKTKVYTKGGRGSIIVTRTKG